MSKSSRDVIYQLFVRYFSNTNTNNITWGTIEQNGCGKMNHITDKALSEIKGLGITHIWYTGIIEHACLTDYTEFGIPMDDADVVKGRAGSPYAIKDYYTVQPDLAENIPNRMGEFEDLISRTHEKGMKVLIDFVSNHVARKYKSYAKPKGIKDLGEADDLTKAFDPNNNFYYIPSRSFVVPHEYNSLGGHDHPTKDGLFDEFPAKATGNDVFNAQPSITDWFETVKLNYGVNYLNKYYRHFDPIPDTWQKMYEILIYWLGKGVDGFRCDMVEMVPVEFWHWVTDRIRKKYPEALFIAEIYKPENYRDYVRSGGFNYLYDKVEMYDLLKDIIQYKSSTDHIPGIWQVQEGIQDKMLKFIENHDEQRIPCSEFAGDKWRGIPLLAMSCFMNISPVMIYFGQEVGEESNGYAGFSSDDGRTTIYDYWGCTDHAKWVNDLAYDGGQLSEDQKKLRLEYKKILNLINDSSVLRQGKFFDLHYFNRNSDYTGYSDRIYCFLRYVDNDALLVLISFSEITEHVNVKIPEAAWELAGMMSEQVQIKGTSTLLVNRIKTTTYDQVGELLFELEPLSYRLIQINANK